MCSFDDWKASGPHEDLPSVEQETCSRCSEPYAWKTEEGEPLCEKHYLIAEHRRDEGDDEIADERAEREAFWRDAG